MSSLWNRSPAYPDRRGVERGTQTRLHARGPFRAAGFHVWPSGSRDSTWLSAAMVGDG